LYFGDRVSVLKNRRGISKLEFYHNARKMRKDLTELLLRDFGIHGLGNHLKTDNPQHPIPEGYYNELVQEFSKNIRVILRNLMLNITAANTIYPISHDELMLRRRYQTGAIINCEQLLQEIQYCGDVLPVKASIFVQYIEKIEFELKLLKGWRKANSKLEEQIVAKQHGKQRRETKE
jgi:hypothetical protein